MFPQDRQDSSTDIRQEHRLQNDDGDSRFVTNPRNRAVAWIEIPTPARSFGQWIVAAIKIADAFPQRPVGPGAPKLLDPPVLVRRHPLGRPLPSKPIRFLGQNDP
jgi:hypothetical protein